VTRTRGLSCHEEHDVADFVTTAAALIVRIVCPITRERELATLLEDPETGAEVDLVAEAKRIFAEDLAPVSRPAEPIRPTAPEPATLEELGLTAPTVSEDPTVIDRMVEEVAEPVDHVQEAYEEWVKTEDGRAVAKAIRDRALELRRRGWSHYGIQALAEVARFDRSLAVGPDVAGYRVNNSHLSRLARDLMAHYSDLDGFFEVRELRAKETT